LVNLNQSKKSLPDLILKNPSQKQKKTFKKWHDCSRYVFNQTIDYIRSCVNFSPNWMEIKKDLLKQLPSLCDDVPFQVKAIAVKESHQAFFQSKGHPSFRSCKAPTQSCYIRSREPRACGCS
jgi:putative transposase